MSVKSKKRKVSRRAFVKLAAGVGAFAAGPTVWVRRARAATPAFGAAKHLLILYGGGGLRSQPLFHADVSLQHNPFGLAAGVAAGTEWGVGKILGEQPVPLFSFPPDPLGNPVEMPPVPAIANDIAVLAGVDHEPGDPYAPTDHGTGDMGLATGRMDGDVGLLPIVHRDHPGYQTGQIALPPFDIGLSNFARGASDFSSFRPISLQTASEFTGHSEGAEAFDRAAWARALRERLDERFLSKRPPHVRPYLVAARDAKINAKAYASALRSPALDLVGRPDGELGGVTNQQLLDVLNASPFGGGGQWGLEVSFALRAFQIGVPAVSVLRYLYDTHSDEKTQLPIDAGDLGRQIAGIHFLLHRMTGPTGSLLWDDTIVFVVSEFSRDNTDPATGFNSAEGSDHTGTPAARNQCWAVLGGPVTARGKRIGQLDPQTLQPAGGAARSVRSVLATMLDVLGIDPSPYWADAPISSLFV